MTAIRISVLVVAIGLIAGSIAYLESVKSRPAAPRAAIPPAPAGGQAAETAALSGAAVPTEAVKASRAEKTKKYLRAPEIVDPSGYVNTDPITIGEFIGKKVILVDFWTYSCINCQRTLPYLTSWHEKYQDMGLEILGIHTPEFEFEKNINNVRAATVKYGVKYPVVQDNNYGTWSAYQNRYWPRKYLIDIDGFIVYDHIGEGFYDETEKMIQMLLEERNARLKLQESVPKTVVTPRATVPVEFAKVGSPETYFGASRNTTLGNGTPSQTGNRYFNFTGTPDANKLYLKGLWAIEDEFAENKEADASIIYRYRAKSVYIVAENAAGVPVTLVLTLDGKPLGEAAGADVAEVNGVSEVKVDSGRLYKLIEDSDYGEHTIEIKVKTPGLRAFTFTFG